MAITRGKATAEVFMGVLQGDPMTLIFFCLCIDGLIRECMPTLVHGTLVSDFNFVDEITISGPALSVDAVLLKVGPTVNLAKCKLLLHTLSQLFLDELCVGFERCPDGVVVLGTPIGTDEFEAAYAP